MNHFLKFFLPVFWFVLWLISSYLSFIFLVTNYADVRQLENITYHKGILLQYDILINKNAYYLLVWAIRLTTVLAFVIGAYSFVKRNWLWKELGGICKELSQLLRNILVPLQRLTRSEKISSLVLFTAIILIRLFYLLEYTFTTDEVASFDYFVMEGPLAVTCFYPIPNNHILSNFFSWLYYQFHTDPLLTMRVPTFCISLVGTFGMFLVLIRYGSFAIASFSLGIFSLSQPGVFFAIAGRGYFLLTVLAFIAFFSMLGAMYRPERIKAYWVIFIISSICGFYTVPTFLYCFISVLLVGIFNFSIHKKIDRLIELVFSGFIIGTCSLLLYLPIICISGLDSLINNSYIQPISSRSFWSGFWFYFSYTEGMLIGQERLGKFIICLVLLVFAFMLYRKKNSKLSLKVALPALVMVIFPYVIIMVQRVYAPERVLFYKSVYLYLVISFLFFWLLYKIQLKANLNFPVVVCILTIYGSYQIYQLQKINRPGKLVEQQRIDTFQWLKKYKAQNILVKDPFYSLYLHHYIKSANLNCHIYSVEKKNQNYDLVLLTKSQIQEAGNFNKALGKEVYRNDFVWIYDFK